MNRNKKIIVGVISAIVLVLLIAGGLYFYQYTKPVTVQAMDQSFEIQMPGKVKFKVKEAASEDYQLDLYSIKDEMFLNTTVLANAKDIDLKQVAQKEKDNLSTTKDAVKEVSDLSSISIKDYETQKYSYQYHDENYNKDFYAEIVWIKKENTIYVIDLEVVAQHKSKYVPIFNSIVGSFTIH